MWSNLILSIDLLIRELVLVLLMCSDFVVWYGFMKRFGCSYKAYLCMCILFDGD